MRSESTSAFGQPRLTKPTRGFLLATRHFTGRIKGSSDWPAHGRDLGDIRPWQGARSEMYQGIHERRATQPGTNIARSRRVTRAPWRDFVARLAHRARYRASARALSRQGARVTRSMRGSI